MAKLAAEREKLIQKIRPVREREGSLAADAAEEVPPLSAQVLEHSTWPVEQASRVAERRAHEAEIERKKNLRGDLDRVRAELGKLTARIAEIAAEAAEVNAVMLVP